MEELSLHYKVPTVDWGETQRELYKFVQCTISALATK